MPGKKVIVETNIVKKKKKVTEKIKDQIKLWSIIWANLLFRQLGFLPNPTPRVSQVCYVCKDSGVYCELLLVFPSFNFGALFLGLCRRKENLMTEFTANTPIKTMRVHPKPVIIYTPFIEPTTSSLNSFD